MTCVPGTLELIVKVKINFLKILNYSFLSEIHYLILSYLQANSHGKQTQKIFFIVIYNRDIHVHVRSILSPHHKIF